MQIETKLRIKSNPYLYKYLQENSYWYKYLNRNPSFLNQMEDAMKTTYKLTTKDRIDKIKDTLSFAQSFIDIIN